MYESVHKTGENPGKSCYKKPEKNPGKNSYKSLGKLPGETYGRIPGKEVIPRGIGRRMPAEIPGDSPEGISKEISEEILIDIPRPIQKILGGIPDTTHGKIPEGTL